MISVIVFNFDDLTRKPCLFDRIILTGVIYTTLSMEPLILIPSSNDVP